MAMAAPPGRLLPRNAAQAALRMIPAVLGLVALSLSCAAIVLSHSSASNSHNFELLASSSSSSSAGVSSKSSRLSATAKLAKIQSQALSVEQTNEALEDEDRRLQAQALRAEKAFSKQKEEQSLNVARAKNQKLRSREQQLKVKNAKLALQNEKLKQKMLKTRIALEHASIAAVREQLKAKDFKSNLGLGIQKLRDVTPVKSESSYSSKLAQAIQEAMAKVNGAKKGEHKTHKLFGEYVNACEKGRGCHVAYIPESQEHFDRANHTHLVNSNGIGLPLGPAHRQPIKDAYAVPLRDAEPYRVKLGENKVSFGAQDNYVQWENTVLNPDTVLPPWRHNASHDLEETDGLRDANGFNGTREIYEATPFSGTENHDWRQINLEKRGVNVDSWAGAGDEGHNWDRAGVDHGPPAPAPDLAWDEMERPQWAWDNWAMKSQHWHPEGKENKDMMLGVGWNESAGAFDDIFAGKGEYEDQVEPFHGEVTQHEDHFADWEPESKKNIRLLYGTSPVSRSEVWNWRTRTYHRDHYGLGDVPVSAKQAALDLHLRADVPRTGEPFSDTVVQRGWSGANLDDTTYNNYHGIPVEVETAKPTPKIKLEKMGVKVV